MQRQQSKKANKKQSQRAAPRKQSTKPKSFLTVQKGGPIKSSGLFAAVPSFVSQPTWLAMEGKVHHPELGGGLRVAGRQLLASVTTTAGDSQLFSANGATLNSINSIYLSPDILNGRLALQARNYDRYIFRKVMLHYVPRVPYTQAGSFALGFVSDPTFPNPTFANVTSMCPAVQSDVKEPFRFLIVDDMTTLKSFFCTYDNASSAALRLTVQGTILGVPDVTSIGAITMGSIYIDYLVDLHQPTMDQGFSLRLTPEEIKAVETARRLKEKEVPSEDVSKEIGSLQLRIQQLKTGNLNL